MVLPHIPRILEPSLAAFIQLAIQYMVPFFSLHLLAFTLCSQEQGGHLMVLGNYISIIFHENRYENVTNLIIAWQKRISSTQSLESLTGA